MPPAAVPLTAALIYVLAAWGCAAAITIWAFLAVSVSRFGMVLRAGLLASAPAMCLSPAVLLLAQRTLGAELAGLATIAGVTLLLRLAPAPHRFEERQRARVAESLGSTVFGAVVLQIGVCALLWRRPLLAGAGLATAAAVWTSSALARGLMRSRWQPGRWTVMALVLVAVPSTAWLLEEQPRLLGRGAGPLGMAEALMQDLTEPPDTVRAESAAHQRATPVFSAKGTPANLAKGVPGAILRPPVKRAALVEAGAAAVTISRRRPAKIPFTGEYRLFRTSSGTLPPGAGVHIGTPLDALYKTTNGGAIETQAEQPFDPPVDFGKCARVQVSLANGEGTLAFVAMQLVTSTGMQDLGPALFGLHAGAIQNVEFQVPQAVGGVPVRAIRIAFHSADPDRSSTTVKVAIEGFTFFAR